MAIEQLTIEPIERADAGKPKEQKELKTGEELFFKKFESEFNLTKDNLEKNIDNFKELTEGQKCLVCENLKQITLGRIQEEALTQYKENTAEAKFRSRIWQGISKKYQIAKLEKATAQDIQQGGIEVHKQSLQQLVNGMQEGPNAIIKYGELEIQYASDFENLISEKQKQVDEFNQISTEFSKIPYEWSLETASKKEQKKFSEIKERYEETKKNVLDLKLEELKTKTITGQEKQHIEAEDVAKAEGEAEKNAMLYVNDIDGKVQLNQFLNNHPEVEKQLQGVKDKKIWLRALANVVTERGIYAGVGFLTRTATMSLIGLVGAPLAAAGMGGFIARKRGKETLKERELLSRRGEKDKSHEAKKYSEVKKVSDKIDLLISKLQDENLSDKKRKAYEKSLKVSVDWIDDKLDKGLINFGEIDNRVFNQYNLINALGQGKAWSEGYELDEKYQKRFDLAVNERDSKAEKARKKYLRGQMVRGAIMSAGFATAGYAIRHYFNDEISQYASKEDMLKPEEAEKITTEPWKTGKIPIKEYEPTIPETAERQEVLKKIAADAEKITDQSAEAPAHGASKEVMEELQKKVARQEAIKGIEVKVVEQEAIMGEQIKLATIHKGEGIEHALIRQLKADPENLALREMLMMPWQLKNGQGLKLIELLSEQVMLMLNQGMKSELAQKELITRLMF